MKRLAFFAALTALLAVTAHAQVLNRATVETIIFSQAADPYLCVFANTVEDVMLITGLLDLNGKEVRSLRQREEVAPYEIVSREAERLNAKYISIHIIQRKLIETNGKMDIGNYFLVNVLERDGNRYYLVASTQ